MTAPNHIFGKPSKIRTDRSKTLIIDEAAWPGAEDVLRELVMAGFLTTYKRDKTGHVHVLKAASDER